MNRTRAWGIASFGIHRRLTGRALRRTRYCSSSLAVTVAVVFLGTVLGAETVRGQAVTTSAIAGQVTSSDGTPLSDVEVSVTHLPTGVEKSVLTRSDGRYAISGLRPGGPYLIEARLIGRRTESVEDVRLGLGATEQVNFEMEVEAVQVEELRVLGERAERRLGKGVTTMVDRETVENAPTMGRDLADYVRMTPQVVVGNADDDGPSISVAGQNNRFNSIYIDGAVNNDVFGLSAQGTNGGQTGTTPISLDAIEEFQIAISPFDVTQSGFTGAAINAITRSGTNEFEGSAYYQYRNEALAGKTPTADPNFERTRLPDFTTWRGGFRLGGPIVRNKAFFFVNGELLSSTTPVPFNETYIGDSAGRLEELRQFLVDRAGYDPGGFGNKESFLDDEKFLAKVDWNLGNDHRLSVRHSYSHSDNVDAFSSGRQQINFENTAEVFPNTTNSSAVELNSSFGNKFSNKLVLGATFVRDDRDIAGEPFPHVTISDGDGTIDLGPEPFSTANVLNQDILTLTNNFNWYNGRHTFTFGTNLEYYSIANLFIPFNYGWYFFFGGVEDFMEAVETGQAPFATGVLRGYSLVGDRSKVGDESENIGAFDAYQLGFYAQDEIDVNDRLGLTLGLRVDVPNITNEPRFAPDVFDTTIPAVQQHWDLAGARPGQTPSALLYLQPRVGFEYNVTEDGSSRLRGGAGIFTGRVPFVWPGGMFLNNGANTGVVARFFTGDIPFRTDPGNGVTAQTFGADDPIPSGRLEIFEEEFRYPTVFRTSLGLDQVIADGLFGVLEGQYTKTMDHILITNVNLNPECRRRLNGPDQRLIYACETSNGAIDISSNQIDPRYTNIHRVGNTSEGYTWDLTGRLERRFGEERLVSLSYTRGDAKAVNDGTSSQINSLWRFTENVNGANEPQLSRSDFSLGSRIVGQLRWRWEFLENLATTASLVYIGESGRPFSYTIGQSRNMTGEPEGRDASLFYVPGSASELTFRDITDGEGNVVRSAEQQAADLDAFIEGVPYLRDRRGQYAEKNGDRTPFENVVDLRLTQEVSISGRRFEVHADIFNFTNLLNSDWGRRYVNIFDFQVVRFVGFQDADNGDFTPVYEFRRSDLSGKDDLFDTLIQDFSTYSARWQMQLGVRFSF